MFILAGLMIALPFMMWPGLQQNAAFRMEKEILFQVGSLIMLASWFIRPVRIYIQSKWIALYIIWVIFAEVFIVKGQTWSILPIINIVAGVIFLVSFSNLTQKNIHQMLKIIYWVAVIQSLLGIGQILGFDQLTKGDRVVCAGLLGNPVVFASYLSCVLPFSLFILKKYSGSAIIFVAMVLADSTTAFVATLAASIFILIMKRHYILPVILILASCVVGSLAIKDGETFVLKDRKEVWAFAVQGIKKMPLTGWGPGSWPVLSRANMPTEAYHKDAHNDYLQVAFELGLVGLAFVLAFLAGLFKNPSQNTALLSIVVATMVNAMALFPMEYPVTAYLALFAAGGIYGTRQSLQKA